jgi:hypothetical protein
MATLNWPGFGITTASWTLDQPSQGNQSPYSGVRQIVSNPWHGKWRAHVQLATQQGDAAFRAARGFFTSLKGQINTFHLPAVESAQNANTGVTLASGAAQGAVSMSLTGVTTALVAGNMVTIAGQLLSITSVGTLSGSAQTINFMPALRAAASLGASVETAKPYALMALSDSAFTWDIGSWRRYGLAFDCEEAIGETDTADPALDVWSGGTSGSSSGSGPSFTFPQLPSFISRSLLAAVVGPTDKQVAYLTESGREGEFVFSSTNISANVSGGVAYGDTAQAIYVLPAADTTGASGVWVRKVPGPLNVKWFGAKGDSNISGSTGTDDTAATQAAINYIDGLGGGTLYFPEGYYKTTTYLTLCKKLKLLGAGRKASMIVTSAAGGGGGSTDLDVRNGSAFYSNWPSNSSTATDIILEDIGIKNTNGANVGAAFYDNGGAFNYLTRCLFQGFKYGVIFDQTECSHIDECDFETQSFSGIWLVGGNQLKVGNIAGFTNQHSISRCQFNEGASAYGIVDYGGTTLAVKDNNFNGCLVCAYFAGRTTLTVEGGEYETAGIPIKLASATTDGGTSLSTCAGVSIKGGIYSAGAGNPVVSTAGSLEFGGGACVSTSVAAIQGAAAAFDLALGNIVQSSSGQISDNWGTLTDLPFRLMSNSPAGLGFTNAHRRGEVVWNNAAAAGATLGWRCNVTGNPGTWESIPFPAGSASPSFTGVATFTTSGSDEVKIGDATAGFAHLRSGANGEPEIHIRPNAGFKGVISFTENAVADRWSFGIKPSDGNLYISQGDSILGNVKFTFGTSALNLATGVALQNNGTTVIDGSGNVTGPVASAGAVKSSSSTAGIGYATGAGGAVTQLTSKTTAITHNKVCGQFTTVNSALAAGATASFQVNNSNIVATDTINLNLQSGQATMGTYRYWIEKVAAGSFTVTVENRSAGSLSEALVFNFASLKAVNA